MGKVSLKIIMITYNSENALTFTIPNQDGCTLPTLEEIQSSSFGGYGTGISSIGIQNCGRNGERFPGVLLKTKQNAFGVFLGDEFQPQIYRGQNKKYPSFSSSYDRLTNELDRVVAKVRREEFKQFFIQTPYYKRCRDFSVLDCKYEFDFEAIFQHYGFEATYLDITKNLMVALFFAYTYYSKEEKKYYPISDFNAYSPRLYVSVISAINRGNTVCPISLQMVRRPMNQMAMALVASGKDLKEYFHEYELPKDAFIAQDIYERFNHGNALFPNEPVAEVASDIKKSKEINLGILKQVCFENGLDENEVMQGLKIQNCSFSDIKWDVSEAMRVWINDDIDKNILPFLDTMGYRRVSPMVKD